jgi:hypothetical protein
VGTTVAGIAATLGVLIALLALLGDKIEAKEFRFVRPPTGFERGGLAIFALVLLGFAGWLAAPDRVSAVLAALSAQPAAAVAPPQQTPVPTASTPPPASVAREPPLAPAAGEPDLAASAAVNEVRPSTPAAPASAFVNPVWLRKPSASQVATYYPRRALQAGIDGQVTLQCTLSAGGAPQACEVIEEVPADMQFRVSALKLSGLYVAAPKTVDGAPSQGGVVRLHIGFSAKAAASQATPGGGKDTPAKGQGAASAASLPVSFACGQWTFNRANDDIWHEYANGKILVIWHQFKIQGGYIILNDPLRPLYLRLPVKGGPAEVTDGKAENWKTICEATPTA